MNIQQLRYVSEVARRNLNVSEAAAFLHTSQPGVSKQIRALEEELGAEIFVRQGRRFTAVTDAGREIVATIDRILAEVVNLKSVGREFADHAKAILLVKTLCPRVELPDAKPHNVMAVRFGPLEARVHQILPNALAYIFLLRIQPRKLHGLSRGNSRLDVVDDEFCVTRSLAVDLGDEKNILVIAKFFRDLLDIESLPHVVGEIVRRVLRMMRECVPERGVRKVRKHFGVVNACGAYRDLGHLLSAGDELCDGLQLHV